MTDVQLFFDADATPVNQRTSVYDWDDFRETPGDLTWNVSLQGTDANAVGSADHPGVLALSTDTTSGHISVLTRREYLESRLQTLEAIFQPLSSTSVVYRIGLYDSASPSTGIAVEFDTGLSDTALSLVKYVGGVRTVGATLAINTAHWFRMNWSRSGSGAGTLALTDIDAATSASYNATGLSAGAFWIMYFYVKTLTTAGRVLNIDWFQAAMANMAR